MLTVSGGIGILRSQQMTEAPWSQSEIGPNDGPDSQPEGDVEDDTRTLPDDEGPE